MTTNNNNRKKLSKSILEMKFMKKTKEKVEQEIEDEEGRSMYSNEITDKMRQSKESQYIEETSFAICEDLLVGRLSYKGMNPEIERILEQEEADRMAKLEPKNEKDVTDNEMTNYYRPNHRRNEDIRKYSKYNMNKRKSFDPKIPAKFMKPDY